MKKLGRRKNEETNRYKQDCTFCILATDICGLSHKLGLFDRKVEAESELNLLIDKMIFGSSRFVVCDEYEG